MSLATSFALALLPLLASAVEVCFGKSAEYDAQCGALKNEKACEAQFVCLWGDPKLLQCFSKDTDPTVMARCMKITSEKECDAQFGCAWRSNAELTEWEKSLDMAVEALKMSNTNLPTGVTLGTPSFTSVHDHRVVGSEDVKSVLQSWQTKYNLPAEAVAALSTLVVANSTEFKEVHTVMHTPDWDGHTSHVGYIQDGVNGFFLKCLSKECHFEAEPYHMFQQGAGHDGQIRFHILNKDGSDTGVCLDREHCNSDTSNSRWSDCNHCGAVHWGYDGTRIAEDEMKNCILHDGRIAECKKTYAPVRWPVVQFDGQIQIVGAGGRNWNGEVNVAFIYVTASAKVTTLPMSADSIQTVIHNLQADALPKLRSEATLLKQELEHPSKSVLVV